MGFWAHVDSDHGIDDCWPYLGPVNERGYGTYQNNSKGVPAHRFAFTLEYGAIEPGNEIHHKCFNPVCCNPRHLMELTKEQHAQFHGERRRGGKKAYLPA